MSNMKGLFRAYDVRGDAATLMTPQAAYSIARAFACYLRDRSGKEGLALVLGHDSRPSSLDIRQGVMEALLKEGVNVLDIGECSSPMLATAVLSWGADGGVMVTASHNPLSDNGLKLCREGAISLSMGDGLEEVQGIAERGIFPRDDRKGSQEEHEAVTLYRDALLRAIPVAASPVVCDTGWGSAALTLPLLGGQIVIIHPKSDLRLATHRSTALNVSELTDLSDELKAQGCEWGFAFDSDEDRVGVMHRDYGALSTDEVAFVLVRWAMRKFPKATIVGDLTLSRDIERAVTEVGGSFVRSRVGHSFVEHAMRGAGAVFGAESSGHYFFQDLGHKDSGIAGMLAFMEATTEEHVIEALRSLKHYTTITVAIPRPEKSVFLTEALAHAYSDAQVDWLDGLSVRYPEWGFVLRESQTEPVWRLVVEAERGSEHKKSCEVQDRIRAILERAIT